MRTLDFTLSLIDKLTRPLKQAQASVKGFAETSQAAFGKIAVGGAALFGVVQGIRGSLGPAHEFATALNEASGNGVSDNALKKMSGDALKFSMQYGRSAVEVIKSSADIQSAIGTISDSELPRFTLATNTLAAAMKTTGSEAAAYMGQMYNQFDSYADRIGKVKFAEEIAGKTAYMKQAFGADIQTIADLMQGAKGVGSNYGVGMDEQLAVLGQLKKTLGTEASGSYETYMKAAADGAKTLGLSFVDASGQMLTMPQMLEKLQGRYGKTIEGNLQAQAELDKAFGDGSNVIKQLYGNVDLLKRNIGELGSNDGMKRAGEMAKKMADPWERLMAIWTGMRTILGLTLLPVLYPIMDRVSAIGERFARWMQLFPNIARVIGYAMLALLSFAAAGAVANIVVGISMFLWQGLKALWWALCAVTKIHTVAIWLYNTAMIAANATMRVMRGVLLAVRIAAISAGISFSFLTWPVLLVIAAIAALAVGIYYLIQYWDEIKAAIANTTAFQWLAEVVTSVGETFSQVWRWIAEGWHGLVASISGASLLDGLSAMADSIGNVFSGLWDWLKSTFAETYNWIIEKLNYIPGVSIEAKAIGAMPVAAPAYQTVLADNNNPMASANNLMTGGQIKGIGSGGINKEINSNSKTTTDNRKHFENVYITQQKGMTPEQLAEWQELN
ncbi:MULTISPECIES: phage tail tape measure protein [Yersinia]|uniref:phage tail tape measure protein n=1 Tax=Yersinia TaxID=629 RepID=UPI000EB35671|nr:phage tail tape measure protein [Yersinia sp. IP36721]